MTAGRSISGPSNARTSPQNRYTTSQPLTHIPPSVSGLTGIRPTSTAAGRVRVFGYEVSRQHLPLRPAPQSLISRRHRRRCMIDRETPLKALACLADQCSPFPERRKSFYSKCKEKRRICMRIGRSRLSCSRMKNSQRVHRMEFVGGLFQGRDMLPDQDMDDYGHSRSGGECHRYIVNESLTRILSTQPIPLAEGKYLGSGRKDPI